MKAIFLLALFTTSFSTFVSCDAGPPPAPGDVRRGVTLYVSKLGDNSDRQSWKTAFHTVQKALDAVPDAKGGHQVIVRPDTYVEANLAPAYKGAAGAYNTLVGDFDGRLASGAADWSVIDSGDPEKRFKSWDWWGPIRASDKHWPHGNNQETFSSIVWDRWNLRYLYTAGGDGGFFWDLTNKSGEQFTVVVEDCVGTGRAFGGGVAYPIVLNFTQPEMGAKSTGIICTQGHAPTGRLHVDLEDCFLAGYSVFTPGEAQKAVAYATKGRTRAYVQFKQDVPQGFERLGLWPADLFSQIAPPRLASPSSSNSSRPKLTKLPFALPRAMENTPVVFNGWPLHVLNCRDDTKDNTDGYMESMYVYIVDLNTGDEVCRFGEGHSFANAFVNGPELHVFASEGSDHDWFQSLYHFSTRDLKTWKREPAIQKEGDEHLFNASVCRDEKSFLMAYESNQPTAKASTRGN